jgi:hypothetical protein
MPTWIHVLVGISTKGDAMVCEVCTVEYDAGDPGVIRILDYHRWLGSPIPCPNCADRSRARVRELGARVAAAMEQRILDAILKPKPCPLAVQSALRGEGEGSVAQA